MAAFTVINNTADPPGTKDFDELPGMGESVNKPGTALASFVFMTIQQQTEKPSLPFTDVDVLRNAFGEVTADAVHVFQTGTQGGQFKTQHPPITGPVVSHATGDAAKVEAQRILSIV